MRVTLTTGQQLTITVDNGPLSRDSLAHYRSGLTGLIKSLPVDVEVTDLPARITAVRDALTTIGGQPAVFEFPWTLYVDLQRYFTLAQPAGGNRTPDAKAGEFKLIFRLIGK